MKYINCPNPECKRRFALRESNVGRRVNCPACGNGVATSAKACSMLLLWAWAASGVAVFGLLIGGTIFAFNRVGKNSQSSTQSAPSNPSAEVAHGSSATRLSITPFQAESKEVTRTGLMPTPVPAKVPNLSVPAGPNVAIPAKAHDTPRSGIEPKPAPPKLIEDPKPIESPKIETVAARPTPKKQARTQTARECFEQVKGGIAIVQGKKGHGSGFLIGPKLLATNSHVIREEMIEDIRVRFLTLEEPEAVGQSVRLLYEDQRRDLAILEVGGTEKQRKVLPLAPKERLKLGLHVTVIGYPANADGTAGVLTLTEGALDDTVLLDGHSYYRLTAKAAPGNSGGPVIHPSTGELVGVTTLVRRDRSASFCLPVAAIHQALGELGEGEERERRSQIATIRHEASLYLKVMTDAVALGSAITNARVELNKIGQTFGVNNKNIFLKVEGLGEISVAELYKIAAEGYNRDIGPYRPGIARAVKNTYVSAPVRAHLEKSANMCREIWKLAENGRSADWTLNSRAHLRQQFEKHAEALRKELNLAE